jgi:plastocyanin
MRKSTWVAVVIVLIVAVGGAVALNNKSSTNSAPTQNNSSTTSTATNSDQKPAAGTINIRDMMFTPSQITVKKGATVTWTNNDSTTHTVVDDLSNVGGPHSDDIQPGSSYSFKFNKTGSFQYHCTIHSSMRGTIVVQ